MQPSRNIVSLLLVFLMLGSGLPIFHPGDVTRDGRTDLQDAILSVKDLAQTADAPGALSGDLARVVTTLTAVAGLKTVIKQANELNSSNSVQALDAPYLKYTTEQIVLTQSWSGLDDQTTPIESCFYKPVLPPPANLLSLFLAFSFLKKILFFH